MFLQFVREHLVASIAIAIGAVITVGSRMNDAYSLFNAGLPASAWEAIGLTVFFLAVVVLLARWHHSKPKDEGAARAVDASAATPEVVQRPRSFEFFPDRGSLNRAHGSLSDRFANVSSASAILVVGTKFYDAKEHLGVMKVLLLPDPDGEAIKHLAATIEGRDTPTAIRQITKVALQSGTKVRWYTPFMFHSIILADIDRSTGWVHLESVLPHSMPQRRPSYTIYKKDSEAAVLEMSRIFRAIWDKAREPDEEMSLFEAAIRAYEQTRDKSVSILAETLTRNGSESDILIWYCDQMTRYRDGKAPLVKLWGNRPPSRRIEEIYMAPLNKYSFVVENGAMVLQDPTGSVRYTNLSVRSHEVSAAISEIAKRDV